MVHPVVTGEVLTTKSQWYN